ncbi:MAG TPA: cupredoxin domain-containing protein [Nevskiaceae bacterium]|nr:cupredoxin domain-containing protein [Nevskiaceae bacterium]
MNNTNKIIIAVVAVIVIAGGAWLLTKKDSTGTNSSTNTSSSASDNQSSNDKGAPGTNETVAATITYDGNGFSPSKTTVKSGSTIKITNSSDSDLQFDSNPHPNHTDNTELNVGIVAPGESTTFKVTTKGTFKYHNHLASSEGGEIVVE